MIKLVREMKTEDIEQVLELYHSFAKQYTGLAKRNKKDYSRLMRKKENKNFVAIDDKGKIIGYVSSRFEKRNREGRITEIVVNPNHNFQQTAKQLVDKAYNALLEKKPAIIFASSIRNPKYANIFPHIGFFDTESKGVFMYAVLDTTKFLNDIAPIILDRLKETKHWNGALQIECEGHNLFIEKTNKSTQQIVWTNQPIDFKVKLHTDILIRLILSIANPIECLKNRQIEVETTLSQEQTNQLLKRLFPEKQFLIMDYW